MADQAELKVLYVDDEPDMAAVVVRSLALDLAMTVRSVDRGRKALDLLSEGAWYPDVVLLDVTMPDLDGPSTLERITAMTRGALPAIFFTACRDQAALAALAKTNAIGVLRKPFDPVSLARQIRELFSAATATAGAAQSSFGPSTRASPVNT